MPKLLILKILFKSMQVDQVSKKKSQTSRKPPIMEEAADSSDEPLVSRLPDDNVDNDGNLMPPDDNSFASEPLTAGERASMLGIPVPQEAGLEAILMSEFMGKVHTKPHLHYILSIRGKCHCH